MAPFSYRLKNVPLNPWDGIENKKLGLTQFVVTESVTVSVDIQ